MKTSSPLTHPHQTIHQFFQIFHLHEALGEIGRLFKWACREGYDKKHAPGSLLFLVQQLEQLFSAAEEMYYSTGQSLQAVLPPEALEQPQAEHFTIPKRSSAWLSYPRHLSAAEYCNPYFAFGRHARLRDWQTALQELLAFALSRNSIEGCFEVGEVMKWKEVMMAVVEAGWLVEVRNEK